MRLEYPYLCSWSICVICGLTEPVSSAAMVITFNGETRDIEGGPLTVAALLARLDIDPRRVAVELNTHVVKRPLYETAVVKDGDEVEVVNFVGGG